MSPLAPKPEGMPEAIVAVVYGDCTQLNLASNTLQQSRICRSPPGLSRRATNHTLPSLQVSRLRGCG